MTEKDIIFQSQSHPEWMRLKVLYPLRYHELKQQAIYSRFHELKPFFEEWQHRSHIFLNYEKSLPSIIDQLNSIKFNSDEYDLIIDERLIDIFYSECLCFPIEKLIEKSKSIPSLEWEIMNLINNSIIPLYLARERIHNNLVDLIGLSTDEIKEIPLWGYFPF